MNEFQNLLNRIEQEIKDLRQLPGDASSFNAIEITLQDLAREAHNKLWDKIRYISN